MLRQKTMCTGCGRTDTGVHASQYFAHVRIPETFDFGFDPVKRLNQILPEDIAVFDFTPVPANFHAQHDATSRTYTYRFHLHKNPFLDHLSAFFGHRDLDFGKMKRAIALLPGTTDFRGMCKQPHLYKSTRCQLSKASLTEVVKEREYRFDFTSDRFLRNMVRLLVGNIIGVGNGQLPLADFERYLRSGERPPHFVLAPPEGLFLSGVEYARLGKMPGSPKLPTHPF